MSQYHAVTTSAPQKGWPSVAWLLIFAAVALILWRYETVGPLDRQLALAVAFTLMRKWRGTLLPSMIAHGINNGVATLLLFVMS